jgi:hypothetical protein
MIDAIHWQDEELKPRLNQPWGILNRLAVAPYDGLGQQVVLIRDCGKIVTFLDRVGDYSGARAIRERRMQNGLASDRVGIGRTISLHICRSGRAG